MSQNSLTGEAPTELGRLTKMTNHYYIHSNKLCDDMPTEIEALTSGLAYFAITTANSIGTTCGWVEDAGGRFPELGSTSTTSIDYAAQGLTGTIPTQFGLLTKATSLDMNSNELEGTTRVSPHKNELFSTLCPER